MMKDWTRSDRKKVSASLRLCALLTLVLCIIEPIRAAADETLSCIGVTEAVVDVTLSLPVPGIVTARNFKEGDSVTTNDIILQLDSRLEELEVERYRLVMENQQEDWESTRKVFDKTSSVSRDD